MMRPDTMLAAMLVMLTAGATAHAKMEMPRLLVETLDLDRLDFIVGSSSHLTPRWREVDSNSPFRRKRRGRSVTGRRLLLARGPSLSLGARGTEGSNPSPSPGLPR
jgi:hypothetical protein